ncbi:MAG: hypothetical protein IB618_03065 [Candidatus Pacearchaeota archaeon]|nr:MAG: hypothetical protein IB618_03065 [Candidatus Pacearchaeota archaeon]
MVKWPEWLVFGISFIVLAVFCFFALEMSPIFGIPGKWTEYLVFGKFFGVIFLILAIASFINLIISASREKIQREIRKSRK